MELMACEVILEGETGFSTGDKEENAVVDTNGRTGKQHRVWKEKHLLEHSKAMRGKDGSRNLEDPLLEAERFELCAVGYEGGVGYVK